MRVLTVGNMYPPHHLGGYELVWRSAVAELRRRGHQVRVLTTDFRTPSTAPDEPDTFRELRWYWRDHAWPRIGWRARMALERHNGRVLERHLAESRPDVVGWWAMGGMSLSLIERVRRAALPAVAFVHDDWLVYAPRVDRWISWFQRRPRLAAAAERATGLPARVDLEAAARYVLVSETVRSHARAAGYELAGSSIAHSGIDPSYLGPSPERAWEWSLLYVGRIDERKGVSDAVAALTALPSAAVLTLAGAGDPSVTAQVRELASRLGIRDRVHEAGMCPPSSLRRLYSSADALLFPVRWEEPWGLVPLEAMAAGCPVIATGTGGSGEYLRHGVNCLLVGAGRPDEIAQAVRRLAKDTNLRARLRRGGVQTARLHTEAVFHDAVVDALERAVDSRPAAPARPGY